MKVAQFTSSSTAQIENDAVSSNSPIHNPINDPENPLLNPNLNPLLIPLFNPNSNPNSNSNDPHSHPSHPSHPSQNGIINALSASNNDYDTNSMNLTIVSNNARNSNISNEFLNNFGSPRLKINCDNLNSFKSPENDLITLEKSLANHVGNSFGNNLGNGLESGVDSDDNSGTNTPSTPLFSQALTANLMTRRNTANSILQIFQKTKEGRKQQVIPFDIKKVSKHHLPPVSCTTEYLREVRTYVQSCIVFHSFPLIARCCFVSCLCHFLSMDYGY